MMNTSIQHILNTSILNQDDLNMLFQHKTYPLFELVQLKAHQELPKKEKFIFFIKILQTWNNDVSKKNDKVNDCEYVKNDFIYSWLKSIVVQNQKHIDASLDKLYEWYSSNKFTVPVSLFKKESKNKFKLEQWQIRNSYKSNLPLQIDSYKRRYIFQQIKQNQITKVLPSTTANSPNISIYKQNSKYINDFRKENNFVKNAREDNEMKDFLSNYKKKKVQFYQNMAKNYYKNEFQNGKIIIKSNISTAEKFYKTDHIKNYRIKTAYQSRPFKNSTSNKIQSKDYSQKPSTKLSSQGEYLLFDDDAKFPLVNCDSIGLLTNPFDIKIKKKKK